MDTLDICNKIMSKVTCSVKEKNHAVYLSIIIWYDIPGGIILWIPMRFGTNIYMVGIIISAYACVNSTWNQLFSIKPVFYLSSVSFEMFRDIKRVYRVINME